MPRAWLDLTLEVKIGKVTRSLDTSEMCVIISFVIILVALFKIPDDHACVTYLTVFLNSPVLTKNPVFVCY